MQKSKIDIKEFKRLWDDGDDIDPDLIEDETLKSLYVEAMALYTDAEEVLEKIERYLDANSRGGRYIYEAGHEDVDEQSNQRRPELTH
jgi:hypothetical protein